MNRADAGGRNDAALTGLRVLAMPGTSNAESRYRRRPLEIAKERWGWHIDVMAVPGDRDAYAGLMLPSGAFFTQPDLLESTPWESDPRAVSDIDAKLL